MKYYFLVFPWVFREFYLMFFFVLYIVQCCHLFLYFCPQFVLQVPGYIWLLLCKSVRIVSSFLK